MAQDPEQTIQSEEQDAEVVALLTSHQQTLRVYVNSLLPGNSEAADVAQQANTTIWKKRHSFQPGTNFKAWMFSIARYEVLNFRKQKARETRLQFSEAMEDTFAEELAVRPDDLDRRQTALQSCLKQLRPAQRELIQHRYFHKTPLKQYAENIGRSVGGLKVTLHRIRTALANCIEDKLATGETGGGTT